MGTKITMGSNYVASDIAALSDYIASCSRERGGHFKLKVTLELIRTFALKRVITTATLIVVCVLCAATLSA